MNYTKLFHSILDSTIWQESKEAKLVWITMLAMTDRHGYVHAAIPGLAIRAGVTIPECKAAIDRFLNPDEYSRTKDHGGRRIQEIDGGWELLNHAKYRALLSAEERRDYNTRKQREYRQKEKSVNVSSTPVSNCQQLSIKSTHTDADTDSDTKEKQQQQQPDDDVFSKAEEVMNADKATLEKSLVPKPVTYSWQDWKTQNPRIRIERGDESGNQDDWKLLWKEYGREMFDIMYSKMIQKLEKNKVIWFNMANQWLVKNTKDEELT